MKRKRFIGKTFLFMAGGTGGHVYPALAVADALAEEGANVHWLGNAEGFEGDHVPPQYLLHNIDIAGLRGKGFKRWLSAPWMGAKTVRQAQSIMRDLKPDVVVGMGGFVSGPGGIAARMLGIPLVIHEQNAIAGMTNRILSRFATVVLLGDERAADYLATRNYRWVGNPLRAEFYNQPLPEQRYAQRSGSIRLLVLGGSQGAYAINEILPEAVACLPMEQRPRIVHQCGARWVEHTRAHYEHFGVGAEIVPFIDNVAEAMADSDWMIARAGALTVAEAAAMGISTLFIPLPTAVDDHQTANAQRMVAARAAEICPQSELSAEKLAAHILAHNDRATLLGQAVRARTCATPLAVRDTLSVLGALCHVEE